MIGDIYAVGDHRNGPLKRSSDPVWVISGHLHRQKYARFTLPKTDIRPVLK